MSVTDKSEPVQAPQKCFLCDYDLRGHELPYQCPECGYEPDPAREREEAVAWYCSWNCLLISNPPRTLLCYLDDPRCKSLGLRRLVAWYVLPWIGVLLYGVLLSGVGVTHTFERSITDPNQPGVIIAVDRYAVSHQLFVDTGKYDFTVPYEHVDTEFWWRTPNPAKALFRFVIGCLSWSLLSVGLTVLMFNGAARYISSGYRVRIPAPGVAACSWLVIPHAVFVAATILGMAAEVLPTQGELGEAALGGILGNLGYVLLGLVFVTRFALWSRPLVRARCLAYPVFWILPHSLSLCSVPFLWW